MSEIINHGRLEIKLNHFIRSRWYNKFYKKELVVNDRMIVLKTITNIYVNSGHCYNGSGDSDILNQLYSILWVRHHNLVYIFS